MKRTALILVAAGKGKRAGTEIPKQYQMIGDQQLIAHTLKNLQKSFIFDEIRVVVSKNDIWIDGVLENLGLVGVTTTGGATRTDSVRAGLDSLENLGIDRVFIHDAARPFVTKPLLAALNKALDSTDSAAPALQIADALKTLDGDAVDRDALRRVQTPQAFRFEPIVKAFKTDANDQSFADDIAVAHKAGLSIQFTPGDQRNFKVTYMRRAHRVRLYAFRPFRRRCGPACSNGCDFRRDVFWRYWRSLPALRPKVERRILR